MFTKKEYKFLSTVLSYCSKVGFPPFFWENELLFERVSKFGRHFVPFASILLFGNTCHFAMKYREYFLRNEVSLAILSSNLTLGSFAGTAVVLSLEMYSAEFVQITNHVIAINKKFGGTRSLCLSGVTNYFTKV